MKTVIVNFSMVGPDAAFKTVGLDEWSWPEIGLLAAHFLQLAAEGGKDGFAATVDGLCAAVKLNEMASGDVGSSGRYS